MSKNYLEILNYVLRKPRHATANPSSLKVQILRSGQACADDDAPQIADFSRGGCRLNWHEPLLLGEQVLIRLHDTASGLSLELPAKVRWSRLMAEGYFASGCQFDEELNYEHLGELFLAGFLSTEEIEASQPAR